METETLTFEGSESILDKMSHSEMIRQNTPRPHYAKGV